jgi:hypothetical protein
MFTKRERLLALEEAFLGGRRRLGELYGLRMMRKTGGGAGDE